MTKLEKTEWGHSTEIIENVTQDGRRIDSAGVNVIRQHEMVELHIHNENNEEYVPQTEGLKIVVVLAEEADKISEEELKDMFEKAEPIPVGEVVTCHRGEAHALYNSTEYDGAWVYIKYQ